MSGYDSYDPTPGHQWPDPPAQYPAHQGPLPASPEPTPMDPPRPRRRPIVWAVLGAVVLGAGGFVYALTSGGGDGGDQLRDAATEANSAYITAADGGDTLVIDGEGEASGGATIEDIMQVLVSLETPARVVGQMENTRALDGMQEADWDGYSATWTYHPDEGLDVIIERA